MKTEYENRQDEWIKATGLEVGSQVLVMDKAADLACGWDNTWVPEMNGFVGQSVTIADWSSAGVACRWTGFARAYRFPFFVLIPYDERS